VAVIIYLFIYLFALFAFALGVICRPCRTIHAHVAQQYYRRPSVRRWWSTSPEKSTACSSFALYIAQYL